MVPVAEGSPFPNLLMGEDPVVGAAGTAFISEARLVVRKISLSNAPLGDRSKPCRNGGGPLSSCLSPGFTNAGFNLNWNCVPNDCICGANHRIHHHLLDHFHFVSRDFKDKFIVHRHKQHI